MNFLDQLAADAQMIYEGEFSEDITIVNGDERATVKGLFDLTYDEVNPEGLVVQTTKPRVSVWGPSVPFQLKAGQTVTIRGVDYTIRSVDGQGDRTTGSVVIKLNNA